MSQEKHTAEPVRPGYFKFTVEIDEQRGRVRLFDGADEYIFVLRDGKPFVTGRPGERDISKEKWRAMMSQAGAILRRLKPQTSP